MLDKEPANLVADGGSLRDQSVTKPMHCLELQLFARPDWDSPDRERATPLQHCSPTYIPRLQAASSRNGRLV